jgi:membrane metallo-endopeptidase-like protein 1
MNYGSIGTVIGHEITHSMDDRGRQYDETGSLVNWWTSETEDIFARRVKCLVQQYNNLTVPELGVALNGRKTLTENVADNGGVKMAYQGYLKWMDRNEEELVLPGLAYTSRQMFWIAAATNVCTKYTKESLEQLVLSGRHSPDYFRVVVPLMNSDDFAKDFNCSLGAPMNPHHKCQVW